MEHHERPPLTVQQHQDWIEHKMPLAERDCSLLSTLVTYNPTINETSLNGTQHLNCSEAMLQQPMLYILMDKEDDHVGFSRPLCTANLAIWDYLAPGYLVSGMVLNILAVVIWLRPTPRRHAGRLSRTIVLLACCDVLSLYSGFLRHFARKNSYVHVDVQESGVITCKITEFVVYFSLSVTAWLIALVSVERCVLVVARPDIANQLDRVLTHWWTLLSVVTICGLFNSHIFWTRVLEEELGRFVCINTHEPGWQYFLQYVWPRADLAFTTLLPNLVTLSASAVIISRLNDANGCKCARRRSPGREALTVANGSRTNSHTRSFVAKHSRRITITLLSIVVFYIVCQAPAKFWLIFKPANTLRYSHIHLYFSDRLAWTCLLIVQYGTNVFNFAVYSLSNRHFRRELRCLFSRTQEQLAK